MEENNSDIQSKEEYQELVSSLKGIDFEPSPFMKTRILAQVDEIKKLESKKSFSWALLFSVSLATALLVFLVSRSLFIDSSPNGLDIGKPYVVKADLRALSDMATVSYVEVELDGDIRFSSKKFSKISELRLLRLSWDKLLGKQYLPVIVEGTNHGISIVRLKFYSNDNQVIKVEEYDFLFNKDAT